MHPTQQSAHLPPQTSCSLTPSHAAAAVSAVTVEMTRRREQQLPPDVTAAVSKPTLSHEFNATCWRASRRLSVACSSLEVTDCDDRQGWHSAVGSIAPFFSSVSAQIVRQVKDILKRIKKKKADPYQGSGQCMRFALRC